MRVLLVEDDYAVSQSIETMLKKEGMIIDTTDLGEDGLEIGKLYDYDIIILDLMLPDGQGEDLCAHVVGLYNTPVIMLTSKRSEQSRINGFASGADDYLAKPFSPRELVARVKAVLRRYQAGSSAVSSVPKQQGEFVEYPDLVVNLTNYSVLYKGRSVDMPPKELELLYFLASSPNQVFTREQLLDHIWGYEYIGDTRTVDVHIKRLREKIKDNEYWSLSTVWGIGYKFEVKR